MTLEEATVSFDGANFAVAVLAIVFAAVAYREAVRQNRLSASSVVSDWLRDLRAWASEAVDVLAEATYTSGVGDPDVVTDKAICLLRARHRLSALIDRGRFLLPNDHENEYSSRESKAYRGLRHHAIDALVAAEKVLAGNISLHAFPDQKAALIGLRREFVSAVQSIIDPQSFNKDIAKILRIASEARARDPTLGGLLSDASKLPTGSEGMIDTASKRYQLTRG